MASLALQGLRVDVKFEQRESHGARREEGTSDLPSWEGLYFIESGKCRQLTWLRTE